MIKSPFSSYTPSKNGQRSIEEAISEIQREMDTRKRILDRWVQEGRLSWVDAHDRFERLLSALTYLITFSHYLDRMQNGQDNPPEFVPALAPASELDSEPAVAAA